MVLALHRERRSRVYIYIYIPQPAGTGEGALYIGPYSTKPERLRD